MNAYFGVKWNAPAFEDAVRVETPVGEPCLICEEDIEPGESGMMMAYLGEPVENGDETVLTSEIGPEHIECFMLTIMGSVAHLEERCSCFKDDGDAENDDTRTTHGQARETMEWLILHRRV